MDSKSAATPSSESAPISEKSTLKLGWIGLLIGIGAFPIGWFVWSQVTQDDAPAAQTLEATAVETETLQSAQIRETSEFVGALEAQDRVTVRPEVEGRITQIAVEEGESLAAGTLIMQLSPERPQAVVSGAIADVEVATAARNAAQAALLEAEAERDRALAETTLQDTEYERTLALVQEGALPQQSLDLVVRNQDGAIAAQTAAERSIQVAEANLAVALASLRRAESNAAVATEDLSDFQVVAPITGVVGEMPLRVGDYVTVGQFLTTLTRDQIMDLRLSIPVERSEDLLPGIPVELRTEVGGEPLVVGSISFIADRVEAGAQTILAKATFPNPGGVLRDEQFVRARVIWDEAPGILIPTTAISRVGGQSFVFVMEPLAGNDSAFVAVQRPIQLGAIAQNRFQVTDGLEVGETLITAGFLRLSDGAPVTPESPNNSD